MQLFINGQATEFALTGETTVAEIVAGLEAWATQSRLEILSLLCDGQGPVAEASVTSVERVDLEVVPIEEAGRHRRLVAAEYLEALAQATQATYPAVWAEGEPVRRYLGPEGQRLHPEPDPGRARAQRLAWGLRAAAGDSRGLGAAVAHLNARQEGLAGVSVAFHRGRDAEALTTLTGWLEDLEALTQAFAWWPEPADRQAWVAAQQEWSPLVRELTDALEGRDFVLAADLLEYELGPRWERLGELVPPSRP